MARATTPAPTRRNGRTPAGGRTRRDRQLTEARRALRRGDPARAQQLLEDLHAADPTDLDVLRALGPLLLDRGEPQRALAVLARAAKQDATHAPTLRALASAGEQVGASDTALALLQRLVDQDPADAERHAALGRLLVARAQTTQAVGALQRAATLAPDQAAIHRSLAAALSNSDRLDEAAAAYRTALACEPDHAATHTSLAYVLDQLGDADAAREHRARAVALAPADPGVAFSAKGHKRYTADDPQIAALEQALASDALAHGRRPLAHLALAKMHDDADAPATAAQHARAANAQRASELARRGLAYDATQAERRAQALAVAAETAVADPGNTALDHPRTVLIAGLPRAGKTLLEHRVARHPRVALGGERHDLVAVRDALDAAAPKRYPIALAKASAATRTRTGEALAHHVTAAVERDGVPATANAALTSTLPLNEELAPLLAWLDARTVLVSVERDPRDVLLANYLQWYPNNQPWAFTVEGLVHRHRTYLALVERWQERLPVTVVRVRYEDLLADPDHVTATVLDAAGLPWDAACADAPAGEQHDAASPMDKPDAGQPLHAGFVGAWQRWAPHLPELVEAIDAAGLVDRVTPTQHATV